MKHLKKSYNLRVSFNIFEKRKNKISPFTKLISIFINLQEHIWTDADRFSSKVINLIIKNFIILFQKIDQFFRHKIGHSLNSKQLSIVLSYNTELYFTESSKNEN